MPKKNIAGQTRSPVLQMLHRTHKLVFLVDREARALIESSHGISFSQFHVLMSLYACRSRSQYSIADFLGMTEGAVSRHIEALRKKRLVERRVDPENRRRHKIALTHAGEAKVSDTLKHLEQHFSFLTKTLSTPEQKATVKSLDALISKLLGRADLPK